MQLLLACTLLTITFFFVILYVKILVLWLFQQENNGRLPRIDSDEDMAAMFRLRDERLKTAQVDPTFVEDDLLR